MLERAASSSASPPVSVSSAPAVVNQETRIAYTRAFDEYARRLQTLAMRTGGRYVGLPATISIEEAIFGPMMRVGGMQ